MVLTLREALFFCDGRKLMEGKRKVLRECGKKEEKKNPRARAKRDPNDGRKDRRFQTNSRHVEVHVYI